MGRAEPVAQPATSSKSEERRFLFFGQSERRREEIRKLIALLFAAVMMAFTMSFSGVAFAKITPADPPSCETGGGNNLPPGQQPTCQGGGLDQNEATPATNPTGKAPA